MHRTNHPPRAQHRRRLGLEPLDDLDAALLQFRREEGVQPRGVEGFEAREFPEDLQVLLDGGGGVEEDAKRRGHFDGGGLGEGDVRAEVDVDCWGGLEECGEGGGGEGEGGGGAEDGAAWGGGGLAWGDGEGGGGDGPRGDAWWDGGGEGEFDLGEVGDEEAEAEVLQGEVVEGRELRAGEVLGDVGLDGAPVGVEPGGADEGEDYEEDVGGDLVKGNGEREGGADADVGPGSASSRGRGGRRTRDTSTTPRRLVAGA